MVLPVRLLAWVTSAYGRAPLRQVWNGMDGSWFVDDLLLAAARRGAVRLVGRARMAEHRAASAGRDAPSSSWRGNLAFAGCWIALVALLAWLVA